MGSDRLPCVFVILSDFILPTEPTSVEALFVLQIDREPVYADHFTLLQISYTLFALWLVRY
jgi:hypothetical protein